MESKYLNIESINAYTRSFNLSNKIWDIILLWEDFPKTTVGKQLARFVDSISANITEGFGRYSKNDKIRFYGYSYGSTIESLDWIKKSHQRNLISDEQFNHIIEELTGLPREINQLIKYTNLKLKF